MTFQQTFDRLFSVSLELPFKYQIVRLEHWLPNQPAYPQLYRKFRQSLTGYTLPHPLHLTDAECLLAIIQRNQRPTLVSLLHINIVNSPPGLDTTGRCCYFANSATPHPKHRGRGFNTLLRKIAILVCSKCEITTVISRPFSGANSVNILNRLQFKQMDQLRYLPLRSDTMPNLTESLSQVNWRPILT